MQKKRVLYFDVLNILACIAVISLHHNGVVHTYSNSWTWKTALLVETGAYWAVPVFLMLSGATLMNYRKNYDTVTFFKITLFSPARRRSLPVMFTSVSSMPVKPIPSASIKSPFIVRFESFVPESLAMAFPFIT